MIDLLSDSDDDVPIIRTKTNAVQQSTNKAHLHNSSKQPLSRQRKRSLSCRQRGDPTLENISKAGNKYKSVMELLSSDDEGILLPTKSQKLTSGLLIRTPVQLVAPVAHQSSSCDSFILCEDSIIGSPTPVKPLPDHIGPGVCTDRTAFTIVQPSTMDETNIAHNQTLTLSVLHSSQEDDHNSPDIFTHVSQDTSLSPNTSVHAVTMNPVPQSLSRQSSGSSVEFIKETPALGTSNHSSNTSCSASDTVTSTFRMTSQGRSSSSPPSSLPQPPSDVVLNLPLAASNSSNASDTTEIYLSSDTEEQVEENKTDCTEIYSDESSLPDLNLKPLPHQDNGQLEHSKHPDSGHPPLMADRLDINLVDYDPPSPDYLGLQDSPSPLTDLELMVDHGADDSDLGDTSGSPIFVEKSHGERRSSTAVPQGQLKDIGHHSASRHMASDSDSSLPDIAEDINATDSSREAIFTQLKPPSPPHQVSGPLDPTDPLLTGKQLRQQQAKEARAQKALEKQRAAALRLAEREAKRAAKPGEVHKHMRLEVCERLKTMGVGIHLEAECSTQGLNLVFQSQVLRNAITISRRLFDVTAPSVADRSSSVTYSPESYVILYLDMQEFVLMIQNQHHTSTVTSGISYSQYLKLTRNVFPHYKATILLLGSHKYFRTVKTQANRVHKDKVLNTANNSKKNKELTIIPREQYEQALMDLQLLHNVNLIPVEDERLAVKEILRFNKSVAEAPTKRVQYEKQAQAVRTAGLRIAPSGAGSLTVWQRMLEELRNVSGDVAGAVTRQWSSPLALLQAYDRCGSKEKGVNLVQDIEIRRGASVVQTSRRVGRETARRIHAVISERSEDFLVE